MGMIHPWWTRVMYHNYSTRIFFWEIALSLWRFWLGRFEREYPGRRRRPTEEEEERRSEYKNRE